MQLSPVPAFVLTADSAAQSVVLGVDQGSATGAEHLVPMSVEALILGLDSEACFLRESLPLSLTSYKPGVEPNPSIDFDIEEFFSTSNIQTQTEESGLGSMATEPLPETLKLFYEYPLIRHCPKCPWSGEQGAAEQQRNEGSHGRLPAAGFGLDTMESQFSSVETQTCAELHNF
ncbi:ATM interactor [Heterocephalus glaber]|uniref:ATM interactor n=1 Tax=Heterocephalus glaber TaxID=10181 RepID=G5ANM1_HETGA|nr:ATM interactor [Heterocephalus glaber]